MRIDRLLVCWGGLGICGGCAGGADTDWDAAESATSTSSTDANSADPDNDDEDGPHYEGTETDPTSTGSESDTIDSETGEPTPLMFPDDLIDLTNWKLTLPTGIDEAGVLVAEEIRQPALATFEQIPHFWLDGSIPAVVFRAEVGGVTTQGSSYPRSELREMSGNGGVEAAWSTAVGHHTLMLREAVTMLPPVRPELVVARMRCASGELAAIRLEQTRLVVRSAGVEFGELDPSYALGTEMVLVMDVADDTIDLYYNDLSTPSLTLPLGETADECYFRAGVHTLSNPSEEDAPTDYGEVELYELTAEHRA